MVQLAIAHPPGLDRERRYIFDVVLRDWLGLDYLAAPTDRVDVRITAAGDASGRALHLSDRFFEQANTAWLEAASLPEGPLGAWSPDALGVHVDGPLPMLFGDPAPAAAGLPDRDQIHLPIDVFGSVFFMLSRYEEVVSTSRDIHDRFPARAAFGHHHALLERPLANEYLEVLWACLARLWPGLQRRARTYGVAATHDVDVAFSTVGRSWRRVGRSIAADLVRRKSPGLAARRLASKLAWGQRATRLDPNNCFDFIMATSERHGLKSTFFLMAGVSDPRFDDPYDLETPPVAPLLREIHARGHELGLHPSYHTYRDGARLQAEFATLLRAADRLGLDQPAWGGRQHYLRFAIPSTWRHYTQAGLAYDATLSLADQPGFRCGTCYDFPVYDLERRERLPLRERPLIVMEGTLLDADYLGLSFEAAHERIVRLANACRRFGGSFNLLWHNNRLITAAEQHLYAGVIEAVAP